MGSTNIQSLGCVGHVACVHLIWLSYISSVNKITSSTSELWTLQSHIGQQDGKKIPSFLPTVCHCMITTSGLHSSAQSALGQLQLILDFCALQIKIIRLWIVSILEKCACISILRNGFHLNHVCAVNSDLRSGLTARLSRPSVAHWHAWAVTHSPLTQNFLLNM